MADDSDEECKGEGDVEDVFVRGLLWSLSANKMTQCPGHCFFCRPAGMPRSNSRVDDGSLVADDKTQVEYTLSG